MFNNRGQSLVMFVLVIPILLMILILVLDIGRMYLERRELDNINYIENIEEYKQIVVNNVEQFKKQASVPPTNTENQESLEALGDDW